MAVSIRTQYMGMNLSSPIVAASSELTSNVDSLKNLEDAGAGAVVLKSLFEEEIVAEFERRQAEMQRPGPLFPETTDVYDLLDTENGVTNYLQLIRKAKQALSIPVIASINCTSNQKWTHFSKIIQEEGADALELNIFRMPSDFEAESVSAFEQTYTDIISTVLGQVSIPVAAKVSFYFTLLGKTLQSLSETGIRGLVLFNRFFSPDYDVENLKIVPTNVYSSPADLAISLRWIAIMQGRVSCDLAASTGVHDGDGVIKQLLAGANVVQVASALYRNGIDHLRATLDRLAEWMESQGFSDLSEFRGMLGQQNIGNPAAYDRVQFVRNYRKMR